MATIWIKKKENRIENMDMIVMNGVQETILKKTSGKNTMKLEIRYWHGKARITMSRFG